MPEGIRWRMNSSPSTNHRVSRVVPSLRAGDDGEGGTEQVDDLALAFVAPLRAEHREVVCCDGRHLAKRFMIAERQCRRRRAVRRRCTPAGCPRANPGILAPGRSSLDFDHVSPAVAAASAGSVSMATGRAGGDSAPSGGRIASRPVTRALALRAVTQGDSCVGCDPVGVILQATGGDGNPELGHLNVCGLRPDGPHLAWVGGWLCREKAGATRFPILVLLQAEPGAGSDRASAGRQQRIPGG